MRFDGKVIAITGATGALGQAVTLAFLREGATCAATMLNPEHGRALEAAAGEYRERLSVAQVDVTEADPVRHFFRAVQERFGGLDALIGLAGGFEGGKSVAETPVEMLDRMIALNLRSAFVCAQAAIPLLAERGGGKILLVSARAALKGSAGLGAYSVSKAGVITLTETLADELRDRDIQANCFLPSIIDSPANRRAMPDADHARWVTPDEIARVLLFFAAPDSSPISGAAIPVYGRA